MNYEEFKKRYIDKLKKAGFEVFEDNPEFNDRMAEFYLGLMVYAEFQNEQYEKVVAAQMKQEKQSKIILPKGMEH